MFDSHRTTAGFLVAALAGLVLLVSASASAQEAHGVIVYGETDQANSVAYGFAWNFPARDTAYAEAVAACISSGGTNCIELAWFRNGCGALAMDQHGNAQGKPGITREQAEARALQTCEAAGGSGCNIVGSLCTTPDGEPGTWSGSESVLPVQDARTVVTDPEEESLAREERVLVQQSLNALGFDAGPADGIFGPRTRAAIREWQDAGGHEATGQVTREQFAALAAVEVARDQDQKPRQEEAGNRSREVLVFGPETGPKCADGKHAEGLCWDAIANKPKCFYLARQRSIVALFFGPFRYTSSWSGDCLGNVAHGRGTLHFTGKVKVHGVPGDVVMSIEATGEMAQGNMQGRWIFRGTQGPIDIGPIGEGQYVDSKLVGWDNL